MPGLLAFVSPWLLLGLAVLPVLWFLLRVTPPSPRRIAFPPLRLLLGLNPRDETPARTPLWLLLLRMGLIALIVLALAHPLLNPSSGFSRSGPVVIAVDDGWAAARHWSERRDMVDRLLDDAARDGREVVVFGTAPPAGLNAPSALSIQRAADARAAAAKLTPLPWPADRPEALARLNRLGLKSAAAIVWLSDGIDDGTARGFARGLERLGPLRVMADAAIERAHLLGAAPDQGKDLAVEVRRAAAIGPNRVMVRAVGEDGRLLARATADFKSGRDHVTVAFTNLPTELRNRAVSVVIEGERSAGATLLLDERWRRRPVGIIANEAGAAAQPLLSGAYYLQRALSPFAEVRSGAIAALLKSGIAVLALPDNAVLSRDQQRALNRWMNEGGLVLRFAGPHLAENPDDALLPVKLRGGGRMLGSTLSWEKPAPLAPFAASSPFAGLAVPGDVTISRQVLAEPTIDLAARTWARLVDGTPLVTADRRGKGWLVLVHTTADPEWSNLAISGLFVEMLRRVVAMSEGVAGNVDVALPPVETLDGFGRLGPAAATAQSIAAGAFASTLVSPTHPPGFYGNEDSRRALSLAPAVTRFDAIGALPGNVASESYQLGREVDFRPWLLAAALLLALIDLAVGYGLRGLLPRLGAAGLVMLVAIAGPAHAQNGDEPMVQAANQLHLAYVRTGIPDVDEESHDGLTGLANMLNRRTAVDAAEPIAVDPDSDELVFYPILYWPVVAGEMLPSARAVERLNRYLASGGMIVFDTRNQGEGTPISDLEAQENLRRLAAGLQIPPLIPVPPAHVLTKSFYLMQQFPGRWAEGRVWVEAADDRVNDGVSAVIVGSNDWAGAWAVDANDLPKYPVVPGGERQREMAFRFGINLVMYALTGNYKSDQVHVPAILERLGQ
jgi:hypothetical protein